MTKWFANILKDCQILEDLMARISSMTFCKPQVHHVLELSKITIVRLEASFTEEQVIPRSKYMKHN